ncbi:nitric oxide reductase D protein [Pelagibius litoralis]|uniref:Nitric oxide reductase D protein n=1 Tax=Pelagibius litoralis TaxID=374515 RepID=A0A967EYD4_9PROT|nr:nitric oxide reductase D protein [Pelagibius litoralis]NIA69712.1 nitric oxide reductase D protein [Pelagibius litoralis]
MPDHSFEPWEPEETVGKLWHAIASRLDVAEIHEEAAVDLQDIGARLAVFFRALGGKHSVEIKPAVPETSGHRLSWRRRLGTAEEQVAKASFDGEALRLPARIAYFPQPAANASLYFWLAAVTAHAPEPIMEEDPLRADLRALAAARQMTRATLENYPGLNGLYSKLALACRSARRPRNLPRWEAAVERTVLTILDNDTPPDPPAADTQNTDFLTAALVDLVAEPDADFGALRAPRGYRPFLPVPLWPDLQPLARSAGATFDPPETGGPVQDSKDGVHRARRQKADQAERRDSLILHRFEAILSWAEFLNLNRRVDDDDPDSAKKAADDQDEIALGQITKAPATRLKLHLDLAPEDVSRERLSGVHLYPEWDVRSGLYLPDHCRVLASDAESAEEPAAFATDPRAQRRIRAVKRQFEALRPRRVVLPGQADGDDLDLEAAVRSHVELRATGRGSNRIWRATRTQARDLAVSILLDASRSTESAVTGRAVIDIEREALTALAWGLSACGDDCAINAFSSLRRDRVYLLRCKAFDDPMSAAVEARIAGLRPGFYTRLGAAIRHVSGELCQQAQQRRLLLVITDGKPNDLDHYEGRHGIEDSRMAIREARRAGQAVFGVTIDATGKSWFSRIFGRGGYAVIAHPDRLSAALPDIYRHLVGA